MSSTQLTPKHVETVMGRKDCQRIPDRRARNSKTAMTKTKRLTSADLQTADADDQQRRPLLCSCS